MLTSVWRDLRYALRTLARNPGFAAVAVLALALGIGANSAIFTVVNSVLLQPLRFDHPEQLVIVRERNLKMGFPQFSMSPGNYLDYRDHNQSFSGLAVSGGFGANLSEGGEPERLRGARVSGNFFEVLGRSPVVGRGFTHEEMQLGSHHVVVLGYGLWQRRFGGRSDLLGQSIRLSDESYTVVGVMPSDFQFPNRCEMWVPLAMDLRNWQQRGGHYLLSVGRLRNGVSLQAAQTDLNGIAARAEQQFPNSNSGWDTTMTSLQESVVGNVRPAILTLTAAVGFVLLIACVNLANLLLSRGAVRRREMGIRSSLGAGRGRLVGQLLSESVLLAVIGAAAGLLLAWAGTRLLTNLSPNILPRSKEIGLDLRVLGFTGAIAILTGLLFGLAPAIQMARTDLNAALREGGRGNAIGFRRNRLRSVLVIGEVALALVLLSGAGLLMRSFYQLQAVDTGFDPHNVLTFRTNLPAGYKTDEQKVAFYKRAAERLRALPGVSDAGAAQIFPLAGDDYILTFTQVGKPPVPVGNQPSAAYFVTTPGYFGSLRIPLKRGRVFTEHDDAAAAPVSVISESMARQFYPRENPIGQMIQMGNGSKPSEIVGVVGDVRDQQLETMGRPAVYQPEAQVTFSGMYWAVRTHGDPSAMIPAVRAAMREIDPEMPLDGIGPVDGLLVSALAQRRFAMVLMAVFAGLALVLSMVGIYGVISYSVTQATQEIGIRMALGAQRGNVLSMVFRYAGVLLAAGLVIGISAALFTGRLLVSQLYEVRPIDPATYAAVGCVLLATALLACAVPAWRAMRVDPLVALRNE